MNQKKRVLAGLGLGLALLAAPRVGAKELHWSGFEVHAKIDADGRLHVRERQNIVFDGDWNGGYRVFRIASMQKLDFERLLRVEPATGREIPLSAGDLSQVDQYKWTDATTLRWRSRLPSDAEFDHKEIDYVLEYRLSNVIRPSGARYVLNHDFAFPDREGRIERLSVDLELDPAWKAEGNFPRHSEAADLAPGRDFVVTARLSRVAPGRAAGVLTLLSPTVRRLLLLLLVAGFLYLLGDFVKSEAPSGRLSSLRRIEPDRAWLTEKILAWKPEEVGAAWSDAVGRSEVSAVIARLAGEGKLSLQVEKAGLLSHSVLHMKLLADHARFSGYEKSLIDGLFFEGRKETDTDSIKKHYSSTGFDPASRIKAALEAQVASHPGMSGNRPSPPKNRTMGISLAAAALLALSAVAHPGEGMFLVPIVFSFFILGVPAIVLAVFARKKVEGFPLRLGLAASLTMLGGLAPFAYLGYGLSTMFVAGWMGAALALASAAFNLAKSRETAARITRRRELAAARRYFSRELAKPAPALEDSWVPYLLAFGLNKHVEGWFSKFGAAATGTAFGTSATASSSSTSSSSASPLFTGGGSAFGGAGASAAWVGAMGALSAGVASPSSSGSGGGGGGGGSSGGGGGGGW